MLEELPRQDKVGRCLRQEEINLLQFLIQSSGCKSDNNSDLRAVCVEDLNDGGMGGIRFRTNIKIDAKLKNPVLAAYTDADGTMVSISLASDANSNLYEMDFWKVDFSPLEKYPKPEDIVLLDE